MASKQDIAMDNPIYERNPGHGEPHTGVLSTQPGYGYDQPPQYAPTGGYAPGQAYAPPIVTTTVITTPPAPTVGGLMTGTVAGHRQWTSPLCGCTDDLGDCVYTYFCWMCVMCDVSKRLGDCPCMPFCVPGADINMRSRVRSLGGIKGSICDDCLTVSCCGLCALCQLNREMKAMGI